MSDDAKLDLVTFNALRRSQGLANLSCEGHSQDSLYGDEGELTRDSRFEATEGYFRSLDCLWFPRNSFTPTEINLRAA
jgi:hypothetical protein